MKKEYLIEQVTESRWFYTFTEPNSKGEKIMVEFVKCISDLNNKNSALYIWKKAGYIDKLLETYWNIEVYVYDTEGNCWGRYNPQVKLSENGKRYVINFDWLLEATEENKQRLIDEVYRLVSSATGKTATEEKFDRIKEFAEQYKTKLYTELPDGWRIIGSMTAPIGSTWICNNQPFKSRKRQHALLII
jgi:hypothetical protein